MISKEEKGNLSLSRRRVKISKDEKEKLCAQLRTGTIDLVEICASKYDIHNSIIMGFIFDFILGSWAENCDKKNFDSFSDSMVKDFIKKLEVLKEMRE